VEPIIERINEDNGQGKGQGQEIHPGIMANSIEDHCQRSASPGPIQVTRSLPRTELAQLEALQEYPDQHRWDAIRPGERTDKTARAKEQYIPSQKESNNGDTRKQLMARSKYFYCTRLQINWTENQYTRSRHYVFDQYSRYKNCLWPGPRAQEHIQYGRRSIEKRLIQNWSHRYIGCRKYRIRAFNTISNHDYRSL